VLKRVRNRWRGTVRMLARSSNIPTAIVLVVALVAAGFAEMQNRSVYEERERAHVLDRVALLRARLEGNINANIQLVRGLVSMVAVEPDVDQARFSEIGRHLFRENTQLRHVAAAPDMVLSMVYPLTGNESAIGLDYRTVPDQLRSAEMARNRRQMVFAGPVELVQGGVAFIGRFPVFVPTGPGQESFWGIISAVVDTNRLYIESGLLDADLDVRVAISGRDGMGAGRPENVFFGNRAILRDNPVVADIMLPSGRWQIAAVPVGGWASEPPDTWQLRAMMAAAGLLLVIPVFLGGRLNDERRQRILYQKRREAELTRLSRRLELAVATSQVGVWEFNITTGHLHWDDRMNELYGYPIDRKPRDYSHWYNGLHPDDQARAIADFRHAISTGARYDSAFRVVTPTGEERHIRAIGTVYADPGASQRIIGVNWDITADVTLNEALIRAKTQAEAKNLELEAAKARIEHNSLHDSLTGLPNRRYLDELLEKHAARCANEGGSAAILHIDLDRFKQINDTLGHAAGDAMLIHASEILKSCGDHGDFIARIGGDEFVILCLGAASDTDLATLANRVIEHMRQPVAYKGHECRFGVSVGIATASGPGLDPKQLLVNADIALYRAKSRGRSRYEFFNATLQAEIITSKRVADDILSGLESDEFIAHFQPQFDAKTLDIVGMEALARWRHPIRGLLMPAEFMAIAEELNVVGTLDRLVLEQSLALQEKWRAAGMVAPRVSVNVSGRRLHDEHLIDSLRALDIAPGTVSFELIESIYLDESDEIVSWNIDHIKELGIDVEIDDFGTGYASIVSLLKLRPTRLKIDRQLVMPITQSQTRRALVQSIIDIGASLGIEAVAEGVETMEHASVLRDLGCNVLQGYAFARPMSGEALEAFISRQEWRQAG
jgi:diguanylate cyclase (GGDEF)-like protein